MNCPCCSGKLLPHMSREGLYWYCLDCRQAMPSLKGAPFSGCGRKSFQK